MESKSLQDIIERLSKANREQEAESSLKGLASQLGKLEKRDLQGQNKDTFDTVKEAFASVKEAFVEGNEKEREYAKENILELQKALSPVTKSVNRLEKLEGKRLENAKDNNSEEDESEKSKREKEQISVMKKVSSGLNGVSKAIKSTVDNAGTIGFGLSALMLLFKPELFIKGVVSIITFIKDSMTAIKNIMEGNWGEVFNYLKENIIGVSVLLGLAAYKLGLISKGKALMDSIFLVKNGLIALGGYLKTKVFPAILGTLKSAATAFAPMLVAAAPFIAIGALIAGLAYGLYKSLESFTEENKMDSIMDSVMYGVKILGDSLAKLGNFFIDVGNWVIEKIGGVADFFGFDISTFTENAKMERFETDSAEKFMKESQERRNKRESEVPEAYAPIDINSLEIPEITSPLRLNQLENNDLKAEESSLQALVIQQQSAPKPASNANVSSKTINLTNNVDIDTFAKTFSIDLAP
jgi:hypothetical protein